MNFLYSDEPVIACSTGNNGHAAMAVLRISGFEQLSQFKAFLKLDLTGPIEPRHVYYTQLRDKELPLDDICLTYFKAPASYNGENILELSVHGNTLNVERILNLFIEEGGCRAAAPGEFTYRALKNKKLSLSQVEGLDLFLNANSGYALNQGLSLLSGNLQDSYQEIFDLFLKHKAAVELSIDFLEDIGEEGAVKHFQETLIELQKCFHSLVQRVRPMEHNLIQPEITLAGLPNSGKSSFFNLLLADDRAIVSSVAGTTRDYLSESIVIEGVKYKLIDTAGIRISSDEIEAEGIRRTKQKLLTSFYSVLLVNPFEIVNGFDELIKNHFDQIYFTHSDCRGFETSRDVLVEKYPKLGSMGALNLLAKTSDWEKDLYFNINKKYLSVIASNPILLDRHKLLIIQASKKLEDYVILGACETDVAVLSSELNALGHCISELIGIISPDQILNSIFSSFCIGK